MAPQAGGVTPCCFKTPFSLPIKDRITNTPEKATCNNYGRRNHGDC